MEVSKYLRDVARSIPGKEQLLISAFAKSFEIIPRQLCYNAGFDATDLLNKLRQKHAQGKEVFDLYGMLGGSDWDRLVSRFRWSARSFQWVQRVIRTVTELPLLGLVSTVPAVNLSKKVGI